MKAITLWQPWASLIAVGAKPYETRSWKPPAGLIGQRIAIHAAARPVVTDMPQDTADAITDAFGMCAWNYWLPRGAVVCTAILMGTAQVENPSSLSGVAGVRLNNSVWVEDDKFGDYSIGRWCWELSHIEIIDPPAPAKGRQGWFDWTPA